MMKAAPPAPFIITEAEFLLELLIIALDPPSQLCQVDQAIEGDVLGQGGKPILGRLGFVLRPLDQQPLFRARLAQQVITMCRPHALGAKRDASQSALPSRQAIVCHTSSGRLKASALTVTG